MIKIITNLETYSVRHPVLRAGKSLESCNFDDDNLETTNHFGYFIDENLVGVASIFLKANKNFKEQKQFQLRGMAILDGYQKLGLGQKLITHCENYTKENKIELLWFNARENAIPFYEKIGYNFFGLPFKIAEIGKHMLMFKCLVD